MQLRAHLRLTVVDPGPHYGFDLIDGRRIQMLELHQWWTYGGLFAGLPSRLMNRRIMDQQLARYTREGGYGPPVLLEPIQMSLERPQGLSFDSESATLPAATCVARFWSEKLSGDDEDIASVLRVIWFQDDFAFPIDSSIQAELAALDWEALAVSWQP